MPPPYRPRTPSGHDIPIPESVFGALHSIDQKLDLYKADTDERFKAQDKTLADLKASSADRWVNLLKVVVPAVATIIGGTVGVQKLTAPEPQKAPEVRMVRGDRDVRLDECRELPAGSTDRSQCFRRVNSEADGAPAR